MLREEEKAMRYGKAGEAASNDREGTCYTGSALQKHLPHETHRPSVLKIRIKKSAKTWRGRL
jgi:hypothetical protein